MSMLRREVNSLLIKIQKGDEESKNVLFQKTYNHLKIVAYPYLRNKNDVEDVLVDAYLKIFDYYKSFDPQKDGYNWMCKTVQNVALDWNKKHQEISLDELKEMPQTTDFEEEIARKDELRRLLQEYPERDRKLVELRFFTGKKFEEIAQETGMKRSNVHKRISKIVKELLSKKEKQSGKITEKTSI